MFWCISLIGFPRRSRDRRLEIRWKTCSSNVSIRLFDRDLRNLRNIHEYDFLGFLRVDENGKQKDRHRSLFHDSTFQLLHFILSFSIEKTGKKIGKKFHRLYQTWSLYINFESLFLKKYFILKFFFNSSIPISIVERMISYVSSLFRDNDKFCYIPLCLLLSFSAKNFNNLQFRQSSNSKWIRIECSGN